MGGTRCMCKADFKNLEHYLYTHNRVNLKSFINCAECYEETTNLCKVHVEQLVRIGYGFEITVYLHRGGQLTHDIMKSNLVQRANTIYGSAEAGFRIHRGIQVMKRRQSKK